MEQMTDSKKVVRMRKPRRQEELEIRCETQRREDESDQQQQLTCGLGFKCAQESVLGEGEVFSDSSLAELEPEEMDEPRPATRRNNSTPVKRLREHVHIVSECKDDEDDMIEADCKPRDRKSPRPKRGMRSSHQQGVGPSLEPLKIRGDSSGQLNLTRSTMAQLSTMLDDSDECELELRVQMSGERLRIVGKAELEHALRDAVEAVASPRHCSAAGQTAELVEAYIFSACCEDRDPAQLSSSCEARDKYARCVAKVVELLCHGGLIQQVLEGDLSSVRVLVGLLAQSATNAPVLVAGPQPDWDHVVSSCHAAGTEQFAF